MSLPDARDAARRGLYRWILFWLLVAAVVGLIEWVTP